MGCITDAMSAPPVDQDVVENGDEAEEPQPVSQWMCDICQSQSEPRFQNPAITRSFFCQAHICQEHAWYGTRELRWNPLIWRMVLLLPHHVGIGAEQRPRQRLRRRQRLRQHQKHRTSVAQSLHRAIILSITHSIVRSFAHSDTHSLDHSLARSVSQARDGGAGMVRTQGWWIK